jgi:PleD family two-component response regulator
MGLITLNPEDDSDMDTLYKKADEALYEAKQGGRNQYVCSKD